MSEYEYVRMCFARLTPTYRWHIGGCVASVHALEESLCSVDGSLGWELGDFGPSSPPVELR